jgi:transcriptional regulator with XRE-family HTH domain
MSSTRDRAKARTNDGHGAASEILKKLRTMRVSLRLKQEDIARRLGIDRTTYIRKEKGLIPITTEEWIKLAEAVDENTGYFFNPDKTDSPTIEEKLILGFFRSLSKEEKKDFIATLRLVFGGSRRKKIRAALSSLSRP